MRAVLQRVSRASVDVQNEFDTELVGQIADGLLILLGVKEDDTEKEADWLVEKILKLRLFAKDGGESSFDASVLDTEGGLLVVSQFTLYADCKKGTRPSFTDAAKPPLAEDLYEYFVKKCRESGLHVETGKFGAHMEVQLMNDGPVTLVIDTPQNRE